jgi:hypothetical protein
MKTITLILIFAFFIPIISSAQTNKNEAKTASTDKIEAYYFHFTSRCVTCRTVESETKQNIENLYPDMVKQGKMSFQAINLDDASGKTIAEKFQISGQTLLLVKGTKKINITNEGFMYARTNPAKFKSIIKEKVDGLLDL